MSARHRGRRPIAVQALYLVLALLGAATAEPRPAQASTHNAIPMHFTHLSVEDGLSQNNVQAIFQDSAGFMWFATESGLNRYDGYEIHRYHRDRNTPAGLTNDFIWAIAEDDDRNLWLATKGGGVVRWNRSDDSFTSFRHDPANPDSIASDDIRTLLLNDDGTVWVGTRNSGLDLLDPRSGTARHFRHDPEDERTLSDNGVYALHRDSRGFLWVGTDAGLGRLLPGSTYFQRFRHDPDDPESLSSDSIRSVFEDSSGTLWIGTSSGGLNRLRSMAGSFSHFRHNPDDSSSLSNDHVRVIFEDRSRRLWIGTADGLNLLHREDGRFDRYVHAAADERTLNDSYVNSIYQDRSGLLWVGTRFAGVSKWNPRSWSLGPYAQPWLSDADVTSFASDNRGMLWVGTLGAGLARIDESTGDVSRFLHDPQDPQTISDDRVMSLLLDSRGMLWIGTMGGGLNRLDIASGDVRRYRHDPADPTSLAADGVMSLLEDSAGRLWVGTYGAGVSVLDANAGQFRHYLHDPDDATTLSDGRASVIRETSDGSIWIGTFGGGINLLQPETGTFLHFRKDGTDPDRLSEDMVYSIHEDRSGELWVGTAGGGLDRIVRDPVSRDVLRFENLSRADGLPSNDIYGIQSDATGHLWLSTNYGLARYDTRSGDVKTFHRSHGLHGEEFNYGAHHGNPGGRLYFGGAGGFNAFLPELVQESTYVPPVVLTSFTKVGEPATVDGPIDQLDGIALEYSDRVISLGFAALEFTAPAQNGFSYMLEGFDADWIDLGNQHHVTFTNLDAGNYLLRVRARTSDGQLGDSEYEIPIVKAAAPWASHWAYALYAAIAMSLAFAIWTSHRRKFLREVEYSHRLEREVALRTEELEQRNSDLEVATRAKSDFLARMSHEIRTPMNGVLGMTQLLMGTVLDDKQRRFAQTIRSSAESLLEIINDILDFSKIEAGRLLLDHERFDVNEVVEETVDLFSAAAAEKGIELVCSTPPGPSLEVAGDAARLKQILVNLLANAVKFTPDGEILLHYSIADEAPDRTELRFEVQDTGIGIKPENLSTIFDSFAQEDGSTSRRFGGTGLGLAICRQLLEIMGGEIGVESTPGSGSCFWFTVGFDKVGHVPADDQPLHALAGLKVLLVDDNHTTLSVVGGYLRALGLAVTPAYSGDSALRQLHAASHVKSFDLVLLDAEIRGQDALQVIGAIRRNPALNDVRVVVMSAAIAPKEDQRWTDAGVNGYLQKPVRQSLLVESLAIATGTCDITGRLESLGENSLPGLGRLNGRVLLVEDNPVNQTVALGMLEEFGCDAVLAINGEDAITQMSRRDFDLVLMDCEMPVMDGFSATAAIRERIPRAASVPIVALTANAVEGDRERCLAAGMQDYLPKPISVEKLHGLLRRWLPGPGSEPAPDWRDGPLDTTSLDSIRNLQGIGGDTMVRRVVNIYLSTSAEALDDLRLAVKCRDAESVRQLAHSLKGSSQNIGAKPLCLLCQQLEDLARSGELDGADALFSKIEAAWDEAAEALRAVVTG